jgi:hypothetical protein
MLGDSPYLALRFAATSLVISTSVDSLAVGNSQQLFRVRTSRRRGIFNRFELLLYLPALVLGRARAPVASRMLNAASDFMLNWRKQDSFLKKFCEGNDILVGEKTDLFRIFYLTASGDKWFYVNAIIKMPLPEPKSKVQKA